MEAAPPGLDPHQIESFFQAINPHNQVMDSIHL